MGITVATAAAVAKAVAPSAPNSANNTANSANDAGDASGGQTRNFMTALLAQLTAASAEKPSAPVTAASKSDDQQSPTDASTLTDPAAFMAGLQAAATLAQPTVPTKPAIETSGGGMIGNTSGETGSDKTAADATVTNSLLASPKSGLEAGSSLLGLGLDSGNTAKSAGFEAALQTADSKLSATDDSAATMINPLLAQQTPTHQAATAASAVQTPVHDARWGDEFGQKVVWMVKQDQQSAQLTLNPPQLGPVEVTIHVHPDSTATATFISPHADVREAIEAALPRLRDMMTAAGVSLGQTNVGSDSSMAQQQQQQQQQNSRFSQGNGSSAGREGRPNATAILGASGVSGGSVALQQGVGLVNTFA